MNNTKLKKLSCYLIVLTISFAVIVTIFMSASGNPQTNIEIKEPVNGAKVDGYRINVKGSSSGLENSTLRPYILVQPIETNIWWTQPAPTLDWNGDWVVCVHIGEADEGNNEEFIIRALITADHLSEGDKITSKGFPSSIAQHQINVTRKDSNIPRDIIIGACISFIINLISSWVYERRNWEKPNKIFRALIWIIPIIVVVVLLYYYRYI